MRFRRFSRCVLTALVLVASARSASAAVVADPAYVVGAIPLPIVNAADMAVVGTSLAIGQGAFGVVGAQSILRLDPNGTALTIVDNLNSIGAIVYDAAGDRLLFSDNAGDLVGATHGDTVYALPNPRAVAATIDAATLTLRPSGSIASAQAILPLPGGDVLVGDAAGPGNGRVVRVSGGTQTDLITGLDYTSGVSLALAGGELMIGNVDAFFTGHVIRYSLAGVALGPLASGLSGSYDQEVDANGNLIVTGGFTNDFLSSTVISIAPGGAVTQIASGFGFSSGLTIDGPSRQIMVLDFGTTRIDTLTPVDALTPGGFGSKECQVEAFGGAPDRSSSGKPKNRWACVDGDPTCDRDGVANGSCVFWVGGCVSIVDPRAPKCTPLPIDSVTVSSTQLPAHASDIAAAMSDILPSAGPACSQTTVVPVTADGKSRKIVFDVSVGGERRDKDTLTLRCRP